MRGNTERRRARLLARCALLAGLTMLATPLVGLEPAYACSCWRASPQLRFDRVDAVFKGTITKTHRTGAKKIRTHTFDVHRVYKGPVTDRQLVRIDFMMLSCGMRFYKNRTYLVFADFHPHSPAAQDAPHRYVWAAPCNGNREIDPAAKPPGLPDGSPPRKAATAGEQGLDAMI